MVKSYPLLKPLTDQLMEEVRAYGILEVSLEQYQIICNSIVRFAQSSQVDLETPFIRGQMALMKRDILIALVSREACMAKQSQRGEKNRERKSLKMRSKSIS